jgi:hypothetical protein
LPESTPLCQVYLTLEPGVLYATPDRVRRFLFSSHLSDEHMTRYAARLGRESFRALLDMTYDLPQVDLIRRRQCPMLDSSESRAAGDWCAAGDQAH